MAKKKGRGLEFFWRRSVPKTKTAPSAQENF